jgi:DNA-binding response OmpR family regulator
LPISILLQAMQKKRPTATILLIDDDHTVRAAIGQALRKGDYELLEAESPEAAAAVWSTRKADIDLILLDVLLPGLSGPELATEILEQNPNAPIIFMSGMEKERLPKFQIPPGARFLYKPFAASELRKTVASVLSKVHA